MYSRSSNGDKSPCDNTNVWIPLSAYPRACLAEHAALYALQIGRSVSVEEYFLRALDLDLGRHL
jgi:hypothetical protein